MTKRLLFVFLFFMFMTGCTDSFKIKAFKQQRLNESLVLAGRLSEDGQLAALVLQGPKINVQDLNTREALLSIEPARLPSTVRTVLMNKRHDLLLVAGEQHLQIWHVGLKSLIGTLEVKGHDTLARVSALSLSDSAKLIGVGMTDGSVVIFDRAQETSRRIIPHTSNVGHLHFFDDKHLLSGSHDGYVKLWTIESGKEIYALQYPSRVSTLTIDRHSNRFFVSDSLRTQQIIATESGKKLLELAYNARFRWFRKALFLSHSPYLLTTSPKSELSLWHTLENKEALNWHVSTDSMGTTVFDIVELSDGDLVTLNSDGVVEYWNWETVFSLLIE